MWAIITQWAGYIVPFLYAIFEWWLGRTDKVEANSTIDFLTTFFTETLANAFKGIWGSILKVFGG